MRVAKCTFDSSGIYILPMIGISWARGTFEVWGGWLFWLFVWQWWKVKPQNVESHDK